MQRRRLGVSALSLPPSHGRRIAAELAKLQGRRVEVVLRDGRVYNGRLLDFEYPGLTLLLSDARQGENSYPVVVISGGSVSEIRSSDVPVFDPREFAEYLVQRLGIRPDAVRVIDEAGVVLVYNTIRVTETGVEGSGGLVPKINFILKEYLEKKRRGEKPL